MYSMMIHREDRKSRKFESIQSCIDAMIENGFKFRKVYFCENDRIFSKNISIDDEGNATVGRKRFEYKI